MHESEEWLLRFEVRLRMRELDCAALRRSALETTSFLDRALAQGQSDSLNAAH
jgi:hypothetical protein